MPSSDHLSPKLNDAIRRGRAIPLLLNYRPPELPDYTLTVYGLLDARDFEGTFVPDDYAGEELIRIPLPLHQTSPVPELKLDSQDAEAIHELWSLWHGGIRDDFLRFINAVSRAVAQARLLVALESAFALEERSAEGKPTPRRKASTATGGKKQRGAKSVRPALRGHGRSTS